MLSYVRYLHIAAVDVAGNIGPTKHIQIKAIEDIPDLPTEPKYIEEVPLKEVTIINQDNQMIRTHSSDIGNLTITMEKGDYLFLGDFAVTAKAVDNVGNIVWVGVCIYAT